MPDATAVMIDAGAVVPPDGQTCFGSFQRICLQAAPSSPITISSSTTIDTGTSSLCAFVVSGGDYCVLAATTLAINAPLRATGTRPLVLLASDTISSTSAGTIDVGSNRGASPETGAGADPTVCTTGMLNAINENGGGAGGSFTGAGGSGGGGVGGDGGGTPGAATTSITTLRGGCPGQDGGESMGTKGHGGGGVVYLVAGARIALMAGVSAIGETGAAPPAGTGDGGGGGGAGGMIAFDAPAISAAGEILANGGSGAAGGGIGGSCAAGPGGAGASGSTRTGGGGTAAAGIDADDAGCGGGGGGGGAGLVKAPAGASLGPNVSPPATP